jgi:uncharacterized protein with PIN domain
VAGPGDVSDNPPIPLLLDAMLGRLARWLRLAGYDAAYLNDADDLELVRVARAEGRLLLTRDVELARRRGVRALLIESQQVDEQLDEVRSAIGPPPEPVTPRCAMCNAPLGPLARAAARERVPPYVFRSQQEFSQCPTCRRVYWPGSHWQAIRRRVDGL